MSKSQQQVVTTEPVSPDVDRRRRMLKYTIAMSVRVICILMMLFVKGWWLLLFGLGAVVLPYFAVLLANIPGPSEKADVKRPGGLLKR